MDTFERFETKPVGETLTELAGYGLLLDNEALAWASRARDEAVCFAAPSSVVAFTPRELGCKEHPLDSEVLDVRRLRAFSREHLPPGFMLGPTDPAAFLSHLAREKPRGVLTCAGGPLRVNRARVLQSVYSAASGEWRLYAVKTKEHRWPLDQPLLFTVRRVGSISERREIYHAHTLEQEQPADVMLARTTPRVIEDTTPGEHCGQMAVRHIVGGHGFGDDRLGGDWRRELVSGSPLGYLAYRLGRLYLPWQMPSVLRRFSIRARMRWWWRGQLERKLEEAIAADKTVVVLAYAQRRKHGQHYQVVSGCERYRGVRYWYVTDGQFAKCEYKLPRGNALLSTAELLRSLPRYGFGRWAPGTFVVVVD